MTYSMLTLFLVVVGVAAVVMLFKRELPPPDALRVAWGNHTPFDDHLHLPAPEGHEQARMVFRGPDRFCPTCGRWLVRIKPNGKIDLAAQAGIESEAVVTYENGVPTSDEVECLITNARCLICEPEVAT